MFAAKDLYCIPVLLLLFLYWNISSVIRQIGESQDGRNEKTKTPNVCFSENLARFVNLFPPSCDSRFCLFTGALLPSQYLLTAWKVSKYGVISGPYFLAFGLNTERYFVSVRIQSECRKIRTRNNSVFGRFSRSGLFKDNNGNRKFF